MKWTLEIITYLVICCLVARWLSRILCRASLHSIPAEWLEAETDLPCLHCTGQVSPLQSAEGWLMVCSLCGAVLPCQEYQLEMEAERTGKVG